MKVVIAPDSFKGSVTAFQAALSMEAGVKKAFPRALTAAVPLADGGEGTMDTLVAATSGRKVTVEVTGPLGRLVEAAYGILGDEETVVIEAASAAGLDLLKEEERNPLKTTTKGIGEQIRHALDAGYRRFIIALGGSATNDGGAGMLQALGLQLKNAEGREIGSGGGELRNIRTLDLSSLDPRIKECRAVIASDVENPLLGEFGATQVYGPQKGATEDMIPVLEEGLSHWASLVEQKTGNRVAHLPGSGAAGGLGMAFQAFFPVEWRQGAQVVIAYSGLERELADADLLITGEGRVDAQTKFGKTPLAAAMAAKDAGVPAIVIAGSVGDGAENLYEHGVISVQSILKEPTDLQTAMQEAPRLLRDAAEQVCRTFFYERVHR